MLRNLERLLNSQPSTGCDSRHISLLSSLSADDLKTVSISEECIVDTFSHIKHGKSDGSALVSDHLIHALPAICSSLASLFTAILRPCLSQLGTILLFPYLKVIKILVHLTTVIPFPLSQLSAKLLSGALFFLILIFFNLMSSVWLYKQKMSTTLCFGAVKNIVSRYMHENSAVLLP